MRTHGEHPDPRVLSDPVIHAQGCHVQEFTRGYTLQTSGRTTGRAGAASKIKIQVITLRKNSVHLIQKCVTLAVLDVYRFFHKRSY